MKTLTSTCRRVVAAEPYNDSTEARYSRSLDQRNPYTRSSVTPVHPIADPAPMTREKFWLRAATRCVYALAVYVLVRFA